jgi:hypothetical protein
VNQIRRRRRRRENTKKQTRNKLPFAVTLNTMGLKNGKYNLQDGRVVALGVESLPSNSSDIDLTATNRKGRKKQTTVSVCIHQNPLLDRKSDNAHYLSLVWLDTDVNQQVSSIDMEIKLKNIVDYVRVFDRIDSCERYVKHIGKLNSVYTSQEQLLVIISVTLAPTIISHLHDLPQVRFIYIFGNVKTLDKEYQQKMKQFSKVRIILDNVCTVGSMFRICCVTRSKAVIHHRDLFFHEYLKIGTRLKYCECDTSH